MSDRKVHFSVPIHQIEYLDKQWETASRLARDGSNWLRMGLDRQRFKDRIERTGEILNKILDSEFRELIYQERFKNYIVDNKEENLEQQAKNITEIATTAAEKEFDRTTETVPTATTTIINKQFIENSTIHSTQPQQEEEQQQPSLQKQTQYQIYNNKKKNRHRRKKRNKVRRKHRG